MTTTKRVGSASELRKLLAGAEQAGPVHRIEYRDRIAAHGQPAIEAIAPWLADPALAAFAIRVIERVGRDGEQEAAVETLRGARRTTDPHVRADLDWALLHLRAPVGMAATPAPPAARPPRVVRAQRPLEVGRVAGATRRTIHARTSDTS